MLNNLNIKKKKKERKIKIHFNGVILMHNKLSKSYFYNVGDNDKIIQTSQFPFGGFRQKLQFTCHPKIRL